jgi:hypothetical protein
MMSFSSRWLKIKSYPNSGNGKVEFTVARDEKQVGAEVWRVEILVTVVNRAKRSSRIPNCFHPKYRVSQILEAEYKLAKFYKPIKIG